MHFGKYLSGVVGFLAPLVVAASGLVPQDFDFWKWVLILLGLGLGTASFATNAYNEHYKTKRAKMVRDQLGIFIAEGQKCLNATITGPHIPDNLPADQWAEQVESYLENELGAAYVTRFRNPAVTSNDSLPGSRQRSNLWSGIRNRLIRLEQFSSELPQ